MKLISLGSSSKGNCHIIFDDDGNGIMLDAGINFNGYNYFIDDYNVKTLLITHKHNDHIKGISNKSLLLGKISVIGEKSILDEYKVPYLNKVPISTEKGHNIANWSILPFEVPHDVENYAYLMQNNKTKHKVLYLTDCGKMEQYTIPDVDTFIVEANYNEEYYNGKELSIKEIRNISDYGHASVQETIRFLKKNVNHNTKNIFLVHISSSIEEYKMMERIVRNEFPKLNVVAINNKLVQGIAQINKIKEK